MRIVVALGGNALLQRRQKPDAGVQEANVKRAVAALAPLAAEHELVVTHGNGPQVGVLALQSASDPNLSTPYPFDVLGAQTQGMIGYWLLQAMQNRLPGRQVAAIINQTLVEAADPAFADPTKFVGEVYDRDEAERRAKERGWVVKPDGAGWRRVVGSPRPQRVVETRLIRLLLESGAVVVCAGGGGVPVVRDESGELRGVEAVVDKDLTSAVLAEALEHWPPSAVHYSLASNVRVTAAKARSVLGWQPRHGQTLGLRYEVTYQHGDEVAEMIIPSFLRNTFYFTYALRWPEDVQVRVPRRNNSVRADKRDLAPIGAEPVVIDPAKLLEEGQGD